MPRCSSPSLPALDAAHLVSLNAMLSRDQHMVALVGVDAMNLSLRKLGLPTLDAMRLLVIAKRVVAIFGFRSPSQVRQDVVGWDIIPVAAVMPLARARPEESLGDHHMDGSHLGFAQHAEIDGRVGADEYGFPNARGYEPGRSSLGDNPPSHSADSSKIADLVKSLVTNDGQPNFIHVRPPIANVPCEECVAAARNTAVRSNPSHAGQLYGI